MALIGACLAGLLFGLGLILSGMANPAKVLNFLDIAGTWDPSLAFVMGGAIAVALPGFWLIKHRTKPLAADQFQIPTRRDISRDLVLGAAIFGIGWGLAGFCPGPALVSLSGAAPTTLTFVVSMIAGIGLVVLSRQATK